MMLPNNIEQSEREKKMEIACVSRLADIKIFAIDCWP